MCGIVGYVGSRQAQNILLDGLARLEYRGYDSAGIAVMNDRHIHLEKHQGRLANLLEQVSSKPLPGCIGIGHTRWATHGEPSDVNAHPHMDMKGKIAVVHNGIIENHQALRTMLQQKGCVFVSQTDTEVIAQLLGDLYDGSMVSTLCKASAMLEGSYALAVLCCQEPDAVFCMSKASPLIIGLGECENYVASDIPAIISNTRQIDILADNEIAVVSSHSVIVYAPNGQTRDLHPTYIDWDVEAAEKGGYAHFMLKEIYEEPLALRRTFSAHVNLDDLQLRRDAFPLTEREVKSLHGITLVACGTAYHAGLVGKYIIEALTRIPVNVDIASEFRYREPIIGKNDLCVAISQSGETADTLAALREARSKGAAVMAITNAVGSTIARETHPNVLYTCAGPEIAVASTKAYLTQVEMLLLFAIDLANELGTVTPQKAHQLLHELSEASSKAERVLSLAERIRQFSDTHRVCMPVFFIGRGLDSALAMEASLKLKEVSYIFSEAYAAGELKHGTIALIEEGTLVCVIMTQPQLADKLLSNVQEVRARGAKVLIICTESLATKAASNADELWPIPDCRCELTPLLAIIPLQLLAYYMAVNRGCDVDKPRNLAKSVTVE